MPGFNKRKILHESNEHALNIFVSVRLTSKRREKGQYWILVEPLILLVISAYRQQVGHLLQERAISK